MAKQKAAPKKERLVKKKPVAQAVQRAVREQRNRVALRLNRERIKE